MINRYKDKILITGAAGFIGNKLIKKLQKNKLNFIGVDYKIINNFNNLIDMDLNNIESLKSLINEFKPKFIYHLAGYAGPYRNELNPELSKELNLGITKKLVKLANNNITIFFPSTDKFYNSEKPKENDVDNKYDAGNYAKYKKLCEKLIIKKFKKHFIFRQPIVHHYGNIKINSLYSGGGSFIDNSIDKLKNNIPIEVFKNIERCFVKVDQLIDVYLMLLTSNNYGIYNLGTKMIKYNKRFLNLSNELNLNKKLISITSGKIIPKKQNLNTTKFRKAFKYNFD